MKSIQFGVQEFSVKYGKFVAVLWPGNCCLDGHHVILLSVNGLKKFYSKRIIYVICFYCLFTVLLNCSHAFDIVMMQWCSTYMQVYLLLQYWKLDYFL